MEPSPLPSSPPVPEVSAADPCDGAAAPAAAAGDGGSRGIEGTACEQAKLFVGGIPWDATEETLRDYFGKYGNVVDAVIMRDKGTGNARGFGFVSFADPSSADGAIHDAGVKHTILGRAVEVRRAIPRGARNQSQRHQYYNNDYQHPSRGMSKSSGRIMDNSQTRAKKIFVGGLSANLTEEEFKGYFEKFGKVTDVVVMHDSETNRPRGFGFITFESEESLENAVKNAYHTLNGKTVEVKRAVPREGSDNIYKNNDRVYGNARVANGKGSEFNSYPGGSYPPLSPRYGGFQGYGTHPYAPYAYGGSYSGGYAFGGYGFNYNAPYANPWTTWNSSGFMDPRQRFMPYGAVGFYPGCYRGAVNPFVAAAVGGYHVPLNDEGIQDDNKPLVQAVNGSTTSHIEDSER